MWLHTYVLYKRKTRDGSLRESGIKLEFVCVSYVCIFFNVTQRAHKNNVGGGHLNSNNNKQKTIFFLVSVCDTFNYFHN